MSNGAPWWKITAVWLARIIAGSTFAVSGWAKLTDLRGFEYKIADYLAVWGVADMVPGAFVIFAAAAISMVELCTGVLIFTGSMRRSAPLAGLALMSFMLPLTAYIAVANPVADCGCFGDLYTLSNTATFLKNIVLTALLVLCLYWRNTAMPLYRQGLQWLVVVLTVAYGLAIAAIGRQVQPVVDFRPYGVGKTLVDSEAPEQQVRYIYSRNGTEQTFAIDSLPDSTWTFVAPAQSAEQTDKVLAVFDTDGNEVTAELFDTVNAPDRMLIMAVTEPGISNLTRARLANEISDYCRSHDIEMIGLVALDGDALREWIGMALPKFDIYSSSDTALKQLVRGPMGLIYLKKGRVAWKRNFASLDPEFLSHPNPIDGAVAVGDGQLASWLAGGWLAAMALLLGISSLTKININMPRRKVS